MTTEALGHFAPFGRFDPAPFLAPDGPGVVGIGIDAGATLTKLCLETTDGALAFGTWLSAESDRSLDVLGRLLPTRLGVTGCGAAGLLADLEHEAAAPIEFDAWARGVDEILRRTERDRPGPYLVMAVGTGTSALRVDGEDVERMGGTALGGGAALGLGRMLTQARSSHELNDLALRGDRQNVDLMVGDLFDDASAVGAVIASSFGKIARRPEEGPRAEPDEADLAAAALGIVSDNVGLLATAYARAAGVERIVYGGSTFHAHPQFGDVAKIFGGMMGFETIVLGEESGHAGCLGAMRIAQRDGGDGHD